MTEYQKRELTRLLRKLKTSQLTNLFHHGDCLGADTEAHDIALSLGYSIIVHPPTNPALRANRRGIINHPAKLYIERNHDIVDGCEVLVATPKTNIERQRSGTWSTIRYARKTGKRYYIINPNEEEG